ncbi:hypothetical protein FOMA001_g8241 [Fusarium oxysporum f. sp. matthiolae]|nr:hypothetical protein FOMA001_g8241 [Fusarium oxysporum f. sp. matthiolae]
MEPSKSSQISKGVANNPEFQALMQGFAANLATFLDNALSASNVKAEPSSHVKVEPSGSLPIELSHYASIKNEKADSDSHTQMVIDLTDESGTRFKANDPTKDSTVSAKVPPTLSNDQMSRVADSPIFVEDDDDLPLVPSIESPLPSHFKPSQGSARDTKASASQSGVRNKSITDFFSKSSMGPPAISSASSSQQPATMVTPMPPRRKLTEDTDDETLSVEFQRKKHKKYQKGWRGPYARPHRKYASRYLDFSETESPQTPMSSTSVLGTVNDDVDDDYMPDQDDDLDDDSDGTEKCRRQVARQCKTDKRSQAATSSSSSRLEVSRSKGCRKAGTFTNQKFENDVSNSFNDIDSDEDFLTYGTALVKASHAHKALVRKELEKPYMIEWAEEAKKATPGFDGNNNRAHITTILRDLYESDKPKFYKWIIHLRAEVQMKLDTYGSTRLNTWLNATLGDDTCFSGVFMAFPNANLTEAIQIAISFTSQKLHWAQYQLIDITLQRFKNASNNAIRKKFWLSVDHSPANFQNLLTGHSEISHLCDWRRCTNPRHIVVEHHNTNIGRSKCFRKAETDAEFRRVPRLCRDHDPPCLLHQSALPVATRVLLEYEHLGNELPIEKLPPQTQSTNGPYILNSGVPLYRWEDNKRVLKHQYAAPMVGPVFPLTQAPSMTYSGTNFMLAVGELPQPLD